MSLNTGTSPYVNFINLNLAYTILFLKLEQEYVWSTNKQMTNYV